MDFSGQTLLLARMAADMDTLADNKTEKLLVRCTSNEGFIAGMTAMVKVGGELRATLPLFVENGYGEAEILIPYGTNYTVEVESYQGSAPASQSFTASQSNRTAEFVYDCDMAPLGIWIQTTDNLLIAAADWATEGAGKTARGIAVITMDHAFLVAKENAKGASGNTLVWGGYGTDVPGITNITNRNTAILDFNFVSKTTAMIAALNPNWDGSQPTSAKVSAYIDEDTVVTTGDNATSGTPVAEAARWFSSEDMSAGSWSVPSMGCLYLMYLNKAAINEALTACGGTTLTNDAHWSSTESSGNYAWYIYFNNGYQYSNSKSNSSFLRPVAAFQSH